MKKKITGFFIIPILLIVVVGCSLDQLSDFMGKTGKNFFMEAGFVEVDNSQVTAVSDKFSNLFDDAGEVDKDTLEEIKKDLGDILDSPEKTQKLKEQLSGDAEPGADLLQLIDDINDGFEKIVEDSDIEAPKIEIKTEADMLVVALVADLLDDLLDDDGDFEDFEDFEDFAEILPELFDILKTAEAIGSESVSQIASFFGDFFKDLLNNNWVGGEGNEK